MTHGQWRLLYPGVDYTFGTADLPVFNHKTPEIGTSDLRTSDADRPRSDGRAFGIDYTGGQTISFDLGVYALSDAEARAEASRLRSVWRADVVRQTPGAVAELRCEYAGRERAVYGRPRRYSPSYADTTVNRLVDVIADFACVDDLFYGTATESVSFGISPPLGGGLVAPLVAPLATTRSSDRSQGMTVDSELPVWPVITVQGPIANPSVTIGDRVRLDLRMTLAYDESVVIDARPWSRSSLRNGASVAGDVRGTRLSQAALPAGSYEVGFGGVDPTGSARITVAWQRTYPSL